MSQAHATGEVLAVEHLEEGTRLHARVDPALAAALGALAPERSTVEVHAGAGHDAD